MASVTSSVLVFLDVADIFFLRCTLKWTLIDVCSLIPPRDIFKTGDKKATVTAHRKLVSMCALSLKFFGISSLPIPLLFGDCYNDDSFA